MCHFAGPQWMSKKHAEGIQQHLRHLEAQIGQLSAADTHQQFRSLNVTEPGSRSIRETSSEPIFPGTVQVNQDGTRYVDPTHWQAVLNQVTFSKIQWSPLETTR